MFPFIRVNFKAGNTQNGQIEQSKEMLFYDKYWSRYILYRWSKMRTAMTPILNAGWSIWVIECLCIIFGTIYLSIFVSLSKQLKFVFIEWRNSNLHRQEPWRMINACITVASDNYLCLYVLCLQIILRIWIWERKDNERCVYSIIINILQLSYLVLLIWCFSQFIIHLIEIIGALMYRVNVYFIKQSLHSLDNVTAYMYCAKSIT